MLRLDVMEITCLVVVEDSVPPLFPFLSLLKNLATIRKLEMGVVEMELEALESSNRITGHALLSVGTRSGVTIVL